MIERRGTDTDAQSVDRGMARASDLIDSILIDRKGVEARVQQMMVGLDGDGIGAL